MLFFDSYPVMSSAFGMALICLSGLLVYVRRTSTAPAS
jgi:hypothetical protein